MPELSRAEGRLIVAAVRVLAHLKQRSPEPQEIADLLELPAATVRLQIATLAELGGVAVVESAFATHVEIRDDQVLEQLPDDVTSEFADELADFDRRKQEETERMANLFTDGEHERRRAEKLGKMDAELRDYRKRKPKNPFADD